MHHSDPSRARIVSCCCGGGLPAWWQRCVLCCTCPPSVLWCTQFAPPHQRNREGCLLVTLPVVSRRRCCCCLACVCGMPVTRLYPNRFRSTHDRQHNMHHYLRHTHTHTQQPQAAAAASRVDSLCCLSLGTLTPTPHNRLSHCWARLCCPCALQAHVALHSTDRRQHNSASGCATSPKVSAVQRATPVDQLSRHDSRLSRPFLKPWIPKQPRRRSRQRSKTHWAKVPGS